MTSHIIDSRLYGAAFAPDELKAIFNDRRRVQKWFDVEAALAEVQGELGMIPAEAAAEIAGNADAGRIDLDGIGAEIRATAHPLVPALRALADLCAGDAGEYVHYGATTQDIMDTGVVLQIKDAWPLLLRDLEACRKALAALAREHRATVMVGRTHGQQALPITFGYKLAVWVDEIDRHLERMGEIAPRFFVGNITGAVGTLASFGPQGLEMQARVLDKLGLATPRICWHSARDRLCELANLLTLIAATFGKIAKEVFNLQRVEFGEAAEPHHHGKVGSSTMPHKRNPANMELVIGLSRLVRAQQVVLLDASFHEHERDAACLRIELAAVPELVIYSGAILAHMRKALEGLDVQPERMRANADMLGGLLLSERVMLALGEKIGKQTAHEVVYEIAMAAFESGTPFRDALTAEARVSDHLSPEEIEALLNPAAYLGAAEEIVDGVVGS